MIHKTPLSKKSKYFKVSEQAKNEKFEARDPRFFAASERESSVSGWKLRNAYRFLDNYMERDMVLIKKEIEKNKKEIKHRRDIHDWVKQKSANIDCLKSELVKIKNRKNRINEMDLEQKSKSDMRKMEIDKVRNAEK